MNFKRYAVYYAPASDLAWAETATRWLGWDLVRGCVSADPIADPSRPRLSAQRDAIVQAPRRYGLHGTIKPPFHLAKPFTQPDLLAAFTALCDRLPPVRLQGLALSRLGRFLALCPTGDVTPLAQIAERCVRDLDTFRADATPAELERRRRARLSPRQAANLENWGYPYVLDEFRFHITLTGRLDPDLLRQVAETLEQRLQGDLPSPFVISDLALVGEDDNGFFHLIQRAPLTGLASQDAPSTLFAP